MNISKMFSLNVGDFFKGLIVAVMASVLMYLLQVLNTPDFNWININWGEIARMASVAGISYLMKNFISNSKGEVLGVQTPGIE